MCVSLSYLIDGSELSSDGVVWTALWSRYSVLCRALSVLQSSWKISMVATYKRFWKWAWWAPMYCYATFLSKWAISVQEARNFFLWGSLRVCTQEQRKWVPELRLLCVVCLCKALRAGVRVWVKGTGCFHKSSKWISPFHNGHTTTNLQYVRFIPKSKDYCRAYCNVSCKTTKTSI